MFEWLSRLFGRSSGTDSVRYSIAERFHNTTLDGGVVVTGSWVSYDSGAGIFGSVTEVEFEWEFESIEDYEVWRFNHEVSSDRSGSESQEEYVVDKLPVHCDHIINAD